LQKQFAGLGEAITRRMPPSHVRISPPVGAEEAKYFLLGLEERLFRVDEEGHVESELLPPGESNAEQQSYRIFSSEAPGPRLLRENVFQLAAASLLILKRGWLKRHVALEPGRPEHRSTPHGVDLLVRSAAGKIFIWAEVKRSGVELEKLVADLRACSRRGPHALKDCGFPQNHPRYEFCISSKPAYLWAVAPDTEICFELNYERNSLELEQLTSLPPRSLIEAD